MTAVTDRVAELLYARAISHAINPANANAFGEALYAPLGRSVVAWLAQYGYHLERRDDLVGTPGGGPTSRPDPTPPGAGSGREPGS